VKYNEHQLISVSHLIFQHVVSLIILVLVKGYIEFYLPQNQCRIFQHKHNDALNSEKCTVRPRIGLDLTIYLGLQVGTLYMKIMYQYLPGGGAILEPMRR